MSRDGEAAAQLEAPRIWPRYEAYPASQHRPQRYLISGACIRDLSIHASSPAQHPYIMTIVLEPKTKGQRITYHVPDLPESFTSVYPPVKEGYGNVFEKENRTFFLNYRKNVLSKYMSSMYKWGEAYDSYSPHPKLIHSHKKQRWEEMYSKPNVQLTFKNQQKLSDIDNFYLLCQFQRQYYNDYTGHLHPMDYFRRDEYKWDSPPYFNSNYVQFPEMYVKYRQPLVFPLTMQRAWIEPPEPCRRLAGKYDPYPDLKFPR